MILENKLLISKEVAEFYKISHDDDDDDENHLNIFIDSRLCFNFKEIILKLWPLDYKNEEQINQKLADYKYKDYLKCYKILTPIFQYTKSTLKLVDNGNYPLQMNWLDNNIKYWKLYTNLNNDEISNPLHILESLLCLTALLENALANVYLTVNQGRNKAPHLLKELIISEELKKVFGWQTMLFLKILLGAPNSINLRNICWHGFPPINGIPDIYHSVLLLIIHSLGLKLNAMEFKMNFKRPQIKDYTSFLEKFPAKLKYDNFNGQNYIELLKNSYSQFDGNYLRIWQQLLIYYSQKEYVRFIIVILPQIELILRLYYGQINQFNVEAKIDEYYITMDTIFETEVPRSNENCNELLNFKWHPTAEGCFKLMYDLFLAPNGCRLRDKISHGEIYLEALNNCQLSAILLQLFLNLLLPDKIQTLLGYESQLHLNCQTKFAFSKIFNQLQDMEKIEAIQLQKYFKIDKRLDSKVLIFQRPHKEHELMLSLKKITANISQIFYNCQQSLEHNSNRLKHRELHSRQRQTLCNLTRALPQIYIYLIGILDILHEMFIIIQQQQPGILLEQKIFERSRRFLKHCLSISENLVKHSNPDVNQWQRMLELCAKFDEYNQKYSINEIIIRNNKFQSFSCT